MNVQIDGVWVNSDNVSATELIKFLIPDYTEEDNKFLKVTAGVLSWGSIGSGGYDGDPTVIAQDATHRFVSDVEKADWNSKADELGADDNYVTDAEKVKLSNLSGTNSGDQNLAPYFNKSVDDSDGLTEGATKLLLTSGERTKLGHITVTQAVDLDDIETRVNNLDAAVVLKGVWDASAGTFPGGGSAQAGASYIVSVAGTVNSISFAVGDRVIAITDNASTGTFLANWFKADYTDQVLSVNGSTGAVTLTTANVSDSSNKRYVSDAQLVVVGNTSGSNSGDQSTIVGISGTLAQFNTACSDADFASGGGTATGTNTGDNATNSQYSGLAASKQDTLISATNIKSVNGSSLLGSGNLVVNGTAPELPMVKMVSTANQTITAGYASIIPYRYTIGNNFITAIGDGGVLQIS